MLQGLYAAFTERKPWCLTTSTEDAAVERRCGSTFRSSLPSWKVKQHYTSRLVKEWNSQVGMTTTPSLPTPQLCLSPKSRLFLCLVFIHERICYIPPSPLWWTWCPSLRIRPIPISKCVTKLYRYLASQDNNHKWKKLVAKRTFIHHLFHFQREGTSTPTRSKVWDGRQDLGRELCFWGFFWSLCHLCHSQHSP